jgi:hypothetical protein
VVYLCAYLTWCILRKMPTKEHIKMKNEKHRKSEMENINCITPGALSRDQPRLGRVDRASYVFASLLLLQRSI